MVLSFLFLVILFIAGLVSTYYFRLPPKKAYASLQSLFLKSTPIIATREANQFVSNKLCSDSTSSSSSSRGSMNANTGRTVVELKRVFATFDKNGDGFITKKELKESLKNISIILTEGEVEEMVFKVDSNGDGLIDFDEFCSLCESMGFQDSGQTKNLADGDRESLVAEEGVGEWDLKEAFNVFDKDNDGLISVEELGLVLCSLGLQEGKKMEDCQEMIRKVDMDGDGMVNFDEFKKMMRGGGKLISVF